MNISILDAILEMNREGSRSPSTIPIPLDRLNDNVQEDNHLTANEEVLEDGESSHHHRSPPKHKSCCGFVTTKTQMYQLLFSCSHSFLSGWLDTLSFANFRCFSNLMTGNLAIGAVAIALGSGNVIGADYEQQTPVVLGLDPNLTQLQPAYAYYSIIGAFILGAFVSTLVELKLRQWRREPFWGMLMLLAISDICGCMAVTFARQIPRKIFTLFFTFFGFSAGVQYEYISAKPYGLLTTLQTGNLQRASRGIARVILRRSSQGSAEEFETENFRILQTILTPICLIAGTLIYGTILRYTREKREVLVIASVWIVWVMKMCVHILQHYKLNVPKDYHAKL